jgi:ribosomal-protein-alanine N-acetyltransferase
MVVMMPTVRDMTDVDLTEVMDIETRAYQFPWSRNIFRDCIRIGYHCRVLVEDRRVNGYGIMSVAAGEAHILNLCIRPARQGQGLARILLDALLAAARENGASTLFLEVRPSNEPARRLYVRAGFCELGVRRGYYPASQGREDALIMAMDLAI